LEIRKGAPSGCGKDFPSIREELKKKEEDRHCSWDVDYFFYDEEKSMDVCGSGVVDMEQSQWSVPHFTIGQED
jgi:hypothetical protein